MNLCPFGIYFLKVNNGHWWSDILLKFRNTFIKFNFNNMLLLLKFIKNEKTKKLGEFCSKLTTKIPERRHWLAYSALLLTLNWFQALFLCFHFHFEQRTTSWVVQLSLCVTENQYRQWNLVNKNQIRGDWRPVYHNIYDEYFH